MLLTKKNLWRRILLRLASEVFKLIKPVDAYLVSRKAIPTNLENPPVFIIGAPRTGSTLIYQVITNYFNVSYISNFSASFYHSLYSGMIFDHYFFGDSPHNLFDSRYGMVGGLKGPNECGQFWYRWFHKDRHFIAAHELSRHDLMGIRKTIGAITKKLSKPIVFKNLNNGQRLQVIQKVLPESLFIFVRRDPVLTAQSILASRQDFFGEKKAWFSVMPKNVTELAQKDYPEQVVQQVYFLEKQIFEDIKLFPDRQHIIVHYENFCKNTMAELERLELFFRQNNLSVIRRKKAILPQFEVDKRRLVSREDFQLIQEESEKSTWELNTP